MRPDLILIVREDESSPWRFWVCLADWPDETYLPFRYKSGSWVSARLNWITLIHYEFAERTCHYSRIVTREAAREDYGITLPTRRQINGN